MVMDSSVLKEAQDQMEEVEEEQVADSVFIISETLLMMRVVLTLMIGVAQ